MHGNITFDLGSAAAEAGGAADIVRAATARSPFTPAAAAAAPATSTRPRATRQLAVAQRLRQRRPGVDRRQGLFRRQLRLRRHQVRHPGRGGRAGAADAAPARVLAARRRREPRRRVRFVPRHAGACAATSTTSWRRRRWTPRSRTTPTEVEVMGSHRAIGRLKGSLGALVSRSRVRCARRRGAVAGRRSARLRGVRVRGSSPGRTSRCSSAAASSTRATSRDGETARSFTTGSGSLGLLFRPAGADDRVTVALSLARAARNPALEELFYFGTAPRQLRVRGRQSRAAPRARARLRRVAALARPARVRRGDLLPQRHSRLHLPAGC